MARRSGNGLTDRFIVEAPLFLEALFAGKPDDLYVLLWTLPEKRSHWLRNVHDAIQFAESLARHDLYVGVGLSGQDYGPTRRCPSNEVAGIFGLWADLDLKSAAHPTAALPATVEEALKILPKELPPTLLILTGNGVHPWWLFREHRMAGHLIVLRISPEFSESLGPKIVRIRRIPSLSKSTFKRTAATIQAIWQNTSRIRGYLTPKRRRGPPKRGRRNSPTRLWP